MDTLTLTLKVGEGSAGFGLCARLWRKPTEPLTVLYVDVKLRKIMQKDKPQVQSTLFTAPEKNAVNEVLAILKEALMIFPNELRDVYGDDLAEKLAANENFYNQRLDICLREKGDKGDTSYLFQPQHVPNKKYFAEKKGIQHTVEFGVYASAKEKEAFFTIECKRLRTKDNATHSRQYVSGETGGIKRFKENQHGEFTQESAMVGYMEDGTFSFWLGKVNEWIGKQAKKDSLWSESDKLIAKKIEVIIAEYVSEHKRKDRKDNIKLTHFWIEMN